MVERWLSILEEMLSVDWLTMDPFDFNNDDIERWLLEVAKAEGLTLGEVVLVFCTDDELLDINIKHLGHDYYTDIITFDYTEDKNISGDLFISADRVRENALALTVGFQAELHRVVVHGVLHLCGYGDKTNAEEQLMREKEDFYLNKL